MKRILLLFSLLTLSMMSGAQGRCTRLHAGLDWGGGLTSGHSYHYNYSTAFGYRVDERDNVFAPHFTGHITGYAGAWAFDNVCIALHAGWAGLEDGRRLIPIFVRTGWYFQDPGLYDCAFLYFDIGSDALSLEQNPIIAAIGAGYRISLSKGLGIDFHMSLRELQCHPVLIDEDTMLPVPVDNIRDNSKSYYGLEFGISLGF